jgi:hypothetical protein
MSASTRSIPSIANRVVRGRPIPRPAGPGDWLALGRALNAEVRAQYGLGASAHTVAVGWTSVPGLEAERFVGASRRIREAAWLPTPTPHINAPRTGGQFIDHAEQDVANAFIDALHESGHRGDFASETLWIYVTHDKGPCTACMQGLANRLAAPGILAQLSLRYPGLLVQLTWETAAGKLGYLQVQDGERLA